MKRTNRPVRCKPARERSARRVIASFVASLATLGFVVVVAQGCGDHDPSAITTIACADRAAFPPVSALLEKRCGTLDCHGSEARALRIYGKDGLRLTGSADAGTLIPGGAETTEGELDQTYRALCGLEPELIGKVVRNEVPPDQLMLIRKAREEERHKGGQLVNKGGAGDVCMTDWLRGVPNEAACVLATDQF